MLKTKKRKFRLILPRPVYITLCLLPAALTLLFYTLRSQTGTMDWVSAKISAPIRGFLGLITSIFPFSVMEVLCTSVGLWLICYLARMITAAFRKQWKISAKRLLTVIVTALYIWCSYCWLWNCGYAGSGFKVKSGLNPEGISTAELAVVTKMFAEKANEFAAQVRRDSDGCFIENRRDYFEQSGEIYESIVREFPILSGRNYPPKPMAYSWLMSRTGYTGIYFALTGEANINVNAPGCLIPATVAHELAHQRGVFSEDEANFVAIAACVTSDNTVYAYSGYLLGLIYLTNALHFADYEQWLTVQDSLCGEVRRDLEDNDNYWRSQETVDTGIAPVDTVLTAVTETVSDAVTTFYDGFLLSQGVEMGVRSYGACVDLLVSYFS